MTESVDWGAPAAARRLGLAIAVSACAHAIVLANAPFAPGLKDLTLYPGGRPLSARLAPPPGPGDVPERLPGSAGPQSPREPASVAERANDAAQGRGLPGAEIFFRAGDLDERAAPLYEVSLVYPEDALAARIGGVVTLRLKIDHRGELHDAAVLEARPAGVFEKAALEAVRSLRFRPAMRNGVPVGSLKTIEVPFYPDCARTTNCVPDTALAAQER